MKKNYYEHLFIVNAILEEDEIKSIVKRHVDFLTENDSELDEVAEWGIQRLAYEIDGKRSGYYVNIYFYGLPDTIARFERNLRIDDNILRFMTIKYDNKMMRHRELQKKGNVPEVFPTVPEEGSEEEAAEAESDS